MSFDPDKVAPRFPKGESHVTVFRRKNGNAQKRHLRCIYCGKVILQASGEVTTIIDTDVKENPDTLEILCDRCGTLYLME